MTIVAWLIISLIFTWLTWLGYRRGAVETLMGWIPILSTAVVLHLLFRFNELIPESLSYKIFVAVIVALFVFVISSLILKTIKNKKYPDCDELKPPPVTWPSRINHLLGASIGLLFSSLTCLLLACLGSTIVFGVSMEKEPGEIAGVDPPPPPAWVDNLKTVCTTMAEVSDSGGLSHIPRLNDYSHEIRSMVKILNAPKEKLELIVEKRKLLRFSDLPEVKNALSDSEYRNLLDRIRRGDILAIYSLYDNPLTEDLYSCPEIREFAKSVTPSELVLDLEDREDDNVTTMKD